MLTKIAVRNLRLFRDKWEFELRPLTVICGSNSSGKSTILKVPLVLKQSTDTGSAEPIEGVLRLAGPSTDLGRYQTVVSDELVDSEIGIGIEIEDKIPRRWLTRLRGSRPRGTPPKRPRLTEYRLSAWFEFAEARTLLGPRAGRHNTPRGVPALKTARFTFLVGKDEVMSWRLSRRSGDDRPEDERDDFSVWFPRKYIRIATRDRKPSLGVADGDEIRFGAHVLGVLPVVLVASRPKLGGVEDEADRGYHLPLPPEVDGGLNDLRNQLDLLRYVGPLRAPARRYYTYEARTQSGLDSTGEGVPHLLREQLSSRITYIAPKTAKSRRGTLGSACGSWLHYLRTGEAAPDRGRELLITALRDFAVEVKLRSTGSENLHALIDSGFGYSQILPVVVSCLLAEQGATILIEQPELHLNPALQVRLAEFFLAVVRSKRQVVIETHSEHLVNALRVLAAEDEAGRLHDMIGLTYLDHLAGGPQKVDLQIRADGTVPDWPSQFFGEALQLSARLLAAQSRFLARD